MHAFGQTISEQHDGEWPSERVCLILTNAAKACEERKWRDAAVDASDEKWSSTDVYADPFRFEILFGTQTAVTYKDYVEV
jgi:hypothetical protein